MASCDKRVLITGATGTVGSVMLPLMIREFHSILAVGRNRPTGMRARDAFIHADFAASIEVESACMAITSPVHGVILASGVDSRASLTSLSTGEFELCMRINCLAPLRLLDAAVRCCDVDPLPVVVVSSDVLGDSLSETLAYAASKAALEEGVRHAVADAQSPGLAVRFLRLSNLGIPMVRTDGSRPTPTSLATPTVLTSALKRAVAFLTSERTSRTVEIIEDA